MIWGSICMDDTLKKIQLIVSEYEYPLCGHIINDVNVRFGQFEWSSIWLLPKFSNAEIICYFHYWVLARVELHFIIHPKFIPLNMVNFNEYLGKCLNSMNSIHSICVVLRIFISQLPSWVSFRLVFFLTQE